MPDISPPVLSSNGTISQQTYSSIARFNRDRDWEQFHNPKDLAISISLEAAELLECFQWSGTDLEVKKNREKIAQETADILIYALQMCQVLGLDPEKIINEKLKQNETKYPVEKAYGSAQKYSEFKAQKDQQGNRER